LSAGLAQLHVIRSIVLPHNPKSLPIVEAFGRIDLYDGGVKHQVQHRFIELRNWVD
jgi:hypothetical protein